MVETDLPWHKWIKYLAVALDLDELEDYRSYVLAGGEPKKFKWATPDHAGTRAPEGQGIPGFLKRAYEKGQVKKADIYAYGQATGKQQVFQGIKWEQRPDGTYYPVGKVYVDESGDEIDIGDQIYVPTQHPEAFEKARQVFGAESLS